MNKPDKIIYTAEASATGGRDGHAKSSDGALDVKLVAPRELGGTGVGGTNPEQMFAAGYAACFIAAMKFVLAKTKNLLPEGTEVVGKIGLGPITTGFTITAELIVHLPGLERGDAQKIVDAAHVVCPYSNATRGNIEVLVRLA